MPRGFPTGRTASCTRSGGSAGDGGRCSCKDRSTTLRATKRSPGATAATDAAAMDAAADMPSALLASAAPPAPAPDRPTKDSGPPDTVTIRFPSLSTVAPQCACSAITVPARRPPRSSRRAASSAGASGPSQRRAVASLARCAALLPPLVQGLTATTSPEGVTLVAVAVAVGNALSSSLSLSSVTPESQLDGASRAASPPDPAAALVPGARRLRAAAPTTTVPPAADPTSTPSDPARVSSPCPASISAVSPLPVR